MTAGHLRFDRFTLDPDNRLLLRDGTPVELNARYFDALALLAGNAGALISKERFLAEVWRGVPVTDEALTQCIKTLRRQLGDDAADPRFIETVPKHGYRFVAPLAGDAGGVAAGPWRAFVVTGAAGTAGGGIAGILGGLFYGFGTTQPLAGAISALLVLLCIGLALGLLGGGAVGFGIAAADVIAGRPAWWRVAGGAAGGLLVGTAVKLVGIDAFDLLLGQSPGDFTGPLEGLLLGGGVGAGAWVARLAGSLRRGVAVASAAGGAAGVVIAALGGRLLGGSLDLFAARFPASRLRLDRIGALFGETGFGPVTRTATSLIEGAVFAACVAGAIVWARRPR